MLGDTAVAVNPNDERYKDIVGKTLILPIVHREIPVIADDYVEMDFGTGCVKITPAHDPNDFEVGLRHNLEVIDTFTDDAHIKPEWGKYAGMDRMEARKAIVEDLEKEGAIVKIEDYSHNVGVCYRCHSSIEPKVSKQWFVKMEPLAKPAIDCVKNGEVKFVPERFDKTYYHWMENIKDWCISRQLWWGHRIPAWYCDECGEVVVSKETPTVCPKCGCNHLTQDPDTLDTWFSSALWPFSTLGWPDKTPELAHYFPISTLVTGYDIIFFWVARMIFSSVENMHERPFDTVFIHGIVRDAQGRKMSKSLGNGIDPLIVIDEYGADALRFTLATGNSPGNDMRFSDEKVGASRNFANKLWNAARFILMNLGEDEKAPHIPDELALEDKWILSLFNKLTKEVTDNLDKFELGIAVQKLYDFIWDVFCDWYIEISKIRLNSGDEKAAQTARDMLVYIMSNTLKLLHPFMPFITEEIWQTLPHEGESIMISQWPVYKDEYDFSVEEQEMDRIMEAVRAIRNRRAEMNVPPSKKAKYYIATAHKDTFEKAGIFMQRLASCSEAEIGDSFEIDDAVCIVTTDAKIYIPLGELVDFEKEIARLNKEKEKVLKDLEFIDKKLNNENFVAKAPKAVVDGQREAAQKLRDKIAMIDESIEKFQK